MVVQCEHCHTKYRIADEKVKGKGVKVRCAKCENVFTVTPSEDSFQESPATAQAPQPAAEEKTETAPPPQDPPASIPEKDPDTSPVRGAAEDLEPSAPGPAETSPGLPPLPPLDDQQDLPEPDAGQQPTYTAPLVDEPASGFELPSLDDGSADPGAQRPAHELDQSGLQGAPADPAEIPDDGGFEIEATLREDPAAGSDPFGVSESEGLPPLPQDPLPDGEWGNIPIDGQDAPDSEGGNFGLAGESGYTPPAPAPMEELSDPPPFDPWEDDLHEDSPVPAYQPETRSSGGGKKIVVTLFLLAALGGGGYYAYPMVMEMIQARTQQTEGTLTPAKIQVKALTRTDGKIIYSVRGEVRNDSAGNVGLIQVEAQFRNASGEVLSKATSYCGNLIPDSNLASLGLEQIRSDLQNELGQSLTNANITPGQTVPFLVILDNPPSGISKVTVTISSFKETT